MAAACQLTLFALVVVAVMVIVVVVAMLRPAKDMFVDVGPGVAAEYGAGLLVDAVVDWTGSSGNRA